MSHKYSSATSYLYLNAKQIHKFTVEDSLPEVNLNLGTLASNFDGDKQKLVSLNESVKVSFQLITGK